MKKIDSFTTEETSEEWLRELYKVIARRRGVMFQMITESARILLFGNAGGAGLVIGLMSASSGNDASVFHWLAITALFIFGLGTLASALTMVLVTFVAVKEAHSAETGLKRFVDGEIDRTQVLFVVENQTFRIADFATVSGMVAAIGFMVGGVIGIVLLALFF